jgi:hypothetical protein
VKMGKSNMGRGSGTGYHGLNIQTRFRITLRLANLSGILRTSEQR